MPPIGAPGVWAGVNDGFAIARQKEQQDLLNMQRRQQMAEAQWRFTTEQQDRQRQQAARMAAGQSLYGLAPPPPQAPMPGTSSAPPQGGAGGPPQGGPGGPPQGAQPMPGQQGPTPPGMPMPGQQGPMPPPMMMRAGMEDPQAVVQRTQADVTAIQRELSRPGLNPEQRSIISGELVKAQERLAQLTGQPAPYRSIPQPSAPGMGAGGPPRSASMMAPPPVGGGAPQQPQGNLLMQIIGQAKANNVPPEQLMDVVDTLSPVLKNQLSEELAALKGSQISMTADYKAVQLRLQELEHERKVAKDDRQGDQADRRLNLSQQRVDAVAKKLEDAKASGEELSPEGLKVAVELTRAGQSIPGGWSKNGISRGNAILNALAKEEEGGAGSGAVATTRADSKAAGGALNQVTKDLAAIRPYKVMLDKNADIAMDLGKKVQLSNSAWANKPIQWLKKNSSSDPGLREYLAQIQIVQTEAARVLNNPRLVGQLTDSARHEMQEIVDGKMPLADTERVLNRMKQDGTNRVQAIEEEARGLRSRTSGTGKQPAADAPATNSKGWKLHVDAKGNKAYVSPDGKQFEEVQ